MFISQDHVYRVMIFSVSVLLGVSSRVHALASGSVVGWGQKVVGADLSTGFVSIAEGGLHSLGLKADGSIVAWGYNGSGQCNVPGANTGFVTIAAGWYHGLGLKADGSIMAWGYNFYGQCNVPGPNTGFVAVAGGAWHSLS